MKRFIILANIILLISIASCAPEPFLEVSESAFEIGYEGGEVQVIVTSNYVWTATSINSDVVSIEPNIGSSGDTATIIISPNMDGIPKELQVMFSCTSSKTYSKQNVYITQGFAQPIITAETSVEEISYSKTEVPIIISSNFIWTSSYDRIHVSLSSTTGQAGADTVIATFSENLGEEPIIHQIDFICSSVALSDTCSIFIKQNTAPSPSISVNPRQKNVSAAGEEFSAAITSLYKWTASASEGIVLSSGSGKGDASVTVTVPENTSTAAKEHFVIFYSSVRQEVVSDTLIITQAGR